MLRKTKDQQYFLEASFKTAPNFGLIKYWGKWNETEILPLNDNIGVTLNSDDLNTITTVKLTSKICTHQIIINSKKEQISTRIQRVLDMLSSRFSELLTHRIGEYINEMPTEDQDKQLSEIMNANHLFIQVKSINSFPTASGLASSSSGMSAFALCISQIMKISGINPLVLSRQCSGSACRCLFGGLSLWKGVEIASLDHPITQQLVEFESQRCLPSSIPSGQWLIDCTKILIFMDCNQGVKEVSSTVGMKLTSDTSELLQARIRTCVPKHISQLINALEHQDYNAVMDVIIRDSNQFHAVCLDTSPPLMYMNDFSRDVISMIKEFNNHSKVKVGYTFDAGPHALLLIHESSFTNFVVWITTLCISIDIQLDNIANVICNEKFRQVALNLKDSNIETVSKSLALEFIQLRSKHGYSPLRQPSEILLTSLGDGPTRLNLDCKKHQLKQF